MLFMVVVSVAWVPMIQNMQGGQLYIYIQSMAADLSPPVAAVYLVAIFWKRANEQVTNGFHLLIPTYLNIR